MELMGILGFITDNASLDSKVHAYAGRERKKNISLSWGASLAKKKCLEMAFSLWHPPKLTFYFLVPLSLVTKIPSSVILLQWRQAIQMDSTFQRIPCTK